jgi:hypothetical protein
VKTTTALLLSLSSLPSLAQIELVPGGDFQLSKPGEPEVTATLVGGFVPWNPPNPPTDLAIAGGGSANYGDDTTGENVGLIGWKKIQGNIDLLNNGVDGSIGCNAFAAWGGDSRIESDPALGTVQAGSVYTITVQVGGPDGGPIGGPLAFHLAADGVPMTPISQVDVTLPGPGGFQEISRTYDATSIADHLGKAPALNPPPGAAWHHYLGDYGPLVDTYIREAVAEASRFTVHCHVDAIRRPEQSVRETAPYSG